ncbi:ATP-binding cassette sub-family C member 3-like isoform X2 [Panonychus citri]|nr:ATP-binding cassette sub-family C member 3-like isoform X2 [Panonychus citri]
MALLGFRKTITQSDLWELPDENKTHLIQGSFEKLLQSSSKSKQSNANISTNNLLRLLLINFWPYLIACVFFKLFLILIAFVSPQLLDLLLTFIKSDDPSWRGYLLAGGMFISAFMESMLDSQHEFWIQTVSMRMRSALISAIYHKSLRLSGLGRRDYTTGEIVNIMAVDTQRITDYINTINVLWSAPIQIIITIILLRFQIGLVSSLAGLAFMATLVPINGYIRTLVKNYQAKVMLEKDKRAKTMSEILNGIKVLKLYAWEGAFEDMVSDIRARELFWLKRQAIWHAVINFIANFAPFGVSLVCFATYILTDSSNVLDANKAFVTIALINILRVPLTHLPMVVSYGANCIISLRRINKYLQGDELDFDSVAHEKNHEYPVTFVDSTFSWSKDEDSVLRNINLTIGRGKLVAIVGPIGSGKSSLLAALLGNLYKRKGMVNVSGRIAYVPQTAWLQNATFRQNIVFGQSFRSEKYEFVVNACSLVPDLKMLPGGDLTEIGERGINLSGGQKQRISIARAVYANSDIYLLDDPLSAVDAHVASSLFDKVIGPNGLLKNKTRILVTHRITFLPQVDEIIVMKDGSVYETGKYDELMSKKGQFYDFIVQYLAESEAQDQLDEDPEKINQMKSSVKSALEARLSLDRTLSIGALSRSISRQSTQTSNEISIDRSNSMKIEKFKDQSENVNKEKHKIIAIETAETGSVAFRVYFEFFQAVGLVSMVITFILYVISSILNFGYTLWLTDWTEDPTAAADFSSRLYRLSVYAALGMGGSLIILINAQIIALGFLSGAAWIHSEMLNKIIRAPMSFYDTTPMGRILNRFTKDIDNADTTITLNFRGFFNHCCRLAISIVGICTQSIYLAVGIIVVGIFYCFVQKFYIASSRQLRRIESITRSPIYSHFSETVTGSTVIRSYAASERFIHECYRRVDMNHSSLFLNIGASRWLSIRLELLGNLIVTCVAFAAVISRGSSTAGSTGLALSYALQITSILNLFMTSFSNIENNIVSIERCLEFTKTKSEASWVNHSNRPRKSWPENGKITLRNYSTRYRPGLDLVLKQIDCTINPNEKVGIVGRTGAGKSSFTLALFRLIEPVEGTILIDNKDISSLGLHDLRSRLTIIPQDPVLFSASLRVNFDPFEKFNDQEIWRSIELSGLKEFVSSLEQGLDHPIAEGGENLSVGQRQLVCLTRALLRKTKILILDEATAAVDVETDEYIQETIRREFNDCTIVTIAHRLNTIMDYDKIIVMSDGEIVEFDKPSNLLSKPESIFYSMVKEAKLI